MKLSEELQARGFVHQIAGESIEEIVDGPKRVVYHGIDPSGDSAHAGHMVNWLLLKHLHDAGHRVIFLVGGGTGMIGDPKPDSERTLLTEEQIDENVAKIKIQAERLIGGGDNIVFVNNGDWLRKLNLIDFLRDTGKHFTVNELIKKEAIARRLEGEEGISYTEFAYPLLQSFDYLTLHREHGCDLQIGGSDQWGNIVAGVDLVRRKEQRTVYAITTPLVVDKTTGKKFGKSEGNAVWLDAEKTSPYVFYQFWLNTADENVIDFLKRFTFMSLDDIAGLEQEFATNPGGRVAQQRLAESVTTLVHGELVAAAVAKVSAFLFGEGTLADLSVEERDILLHNAPLQEVATQQSLVDVLVASQLASSKREARTFMESNAVTLNDAKINNVDMMLETDHFTESLAILRRGKKQLCVLKLVG